MGSWLTRTTPIATSIISQPGCASRACLLSEDAISVLTYKTTPIPGQATGTSGMRKKAKVLISEPRFLPNWIQSLFNALGGRSKLQGKTLVLGGDGRFYNKVSAQTILRMAAANGISHVIVGRNGILTTPAVSGMIPARGAIGGIVLTASHNPAGPDGDWGIKYNTETGAPALEELTAKIYNETLHISEYYLADLGADIDLGIEGITSFANGKFTVEVVNPVTEYCSRLKSIFDFDTIKSLISRPDFSLVFDAMHASTGEYAHIILEKELGCRPGSVINGTPLEDFGGSHPDPNLTYAAALVELLDPEIYSRAPQFGAASDGDGDRNMILGRGVFVSPGDSVAIIADNAQQAIPYFREGLKGVARSMPTSSALDRVAKDLNIPIFETPTGWKYFTNLMDAGQISVCGEESFGTSSDHIREKDGLWAVLSWLSILASKNATTKVGDFFTVENVLIEHWKKYGRTYNMRYDFEEVEAEAGDAVMNHLRGMIEGKVPLPASIGSIDEFEYRDPIDGSLASRQGIRLVMQNGERAVVRLSGTGSAGATIRIYFEKYEPIFTSNEVIDPKIVFVDLVQTVMEASKVTEKTGRERPTVIT